MILCKLVSYIRTTPLQLYYWKENGLFKEFVEKTEISRLIFKPHMFAPTPALQSIFYLICEIAMHKFQPVKFERELLKLSDGGTIGLDWDCGIPDPSDENKKPILVILPGLGGGSDNLYTICMV